MHYSHTMSCSNCRAKSHKPPHTPAHLFKRRSLQDMHAHHISFFHNIITTSAAPNEPNTVNKTCMFLATNCLSKTKHSIHSFTQKPLHKLYIYLTPLSKCNVHDDFVLSNFIALSASDSPAQKQLSPKMQNACSSTHFNKN